MSDGPFRKDVVVSIHPTHVEKIVDGTKTVELRRRFSCTPCSRVRSTF